MSSKLEETCTETLSTAETIFFLNMRKNWQRAKFKNTTKMVTLSPKILVRMVKFFDNFLTIGVVAGILIFQMMDVTWTGKYTVFHFVINK